MELTKDSALRFYEETPPYGNFLDSLERELDFGRVPLMGRTLDVACGAGAWLTFLASKRPHLELWGSDFADLPCRTAVLACPSARIVRSDAAAMPFPSQFFDLLTCFGSIEHFYDAGACLREMARVGRRLVTLVPLDRTSEADQPIFFMGGIDAWSELLYGNGWAPGRIKVMEAWRGDLRLIEAFSRG